MQERHTNLQRYFDEQAITTRKFVLPYIEAVKPITKGARVLEIGCGTGGNMVPFLEVGCVVTGVDISETSIQRASQLLGPHEGLTLIADDIYNRSESDGTFDIIIMRDVIEHIHNQEKFMSFVKRFMAPGAVFFLGFPPWFNPFGGHQQIAKNKLLSKLPFYHILPAWLYKAMLKLGGESDRTIADLLEIKETGISIERFERICKREKFMIERRTLYFINPNYETKFQLKPRVQTRLITGIPFLKNFFVTAGYYLLTTKEESI
jgi:SAM-dependent methyltransferase